MKEGARSLREDDQPLKTARSYSPRESQPQENSEIYDLERKSRTVEAIAYAAGAHRDDAWGTTAQESENAGVHV